MSTARTTTRAYRGTASVAREYDRWTDDGILEHFWGEHIHHGYYPDGVADVDFRAAKVAMVERLLAWAEVGQPARVLDVGCGIGGSSRLLAARFDASVAAITLSAGQARRARALASHGPGPVHYQLADALALPFADGSFDLVWSCESGEHMPDKARFLAEMARVLRPGGCLLVATWCRRDGRPGALERWLLGRIHREWALPPFVSMEHYAGLAETLPLEGFRSADWSLEARPTWGHQLGLGLRALPFLLRQPARVLGRSLRDGLAVLAMIAGYRLGAVRYGVFRARRRAT